MYITVYCVAVQNIYSLRCKQLESRPLVRCSTGRVANRQDEGATGEPYEVCRDRFRAFVMIYQRARASDPFPGLLVVCVMSLGDMISSHQENRVMGILRRCVVVEHPQRFAERSPRRIPSAATGSVNSSMLEIPRHAGSRLAKRVRNMHTSHILARVQCTAILVYALPPAFRIGQLRSNDFAERRQ